MTGFFRATWLLVVPIALHGAGCGSNSPAPAAADTDLLLITLDTTRADHLSCYGHPRTLSPRIDRLAAEGVLFERALAQASVTPVSHASVFTGLYPYRHGLRFLHGNYGYRLPDEARTLAEILGEHGFETAAFIGAFPAGSRFGLEQGFDHFDEEFGAEALVAPNGVVNTGLSQRRAAATNRAVLDWLDGRDARPRFLWVHYFDPHDAHLLPEDGGAVGKLAAEEPKDAEHFRKLYEAEIRSMDRQLGLLVDRLAARDRPLLVAIVGDHGQGLGQHDWWSHGLLYEEQVLVPLILWGDGVPAGVRVPSLVRTVDVLPTVLALLGVDVPAALDGVDLGSRINGETNAAPLTAYAEAVSVTPYVIPWIQDRFDLKNDQLFSLTDGRWKFVLHRFGFEPDELYDLEADAGETRNLIGERPEIVAGLRDRLLEADVYPTRFPILGGLSEEELDRLRSLGYLARGD